MIASIFIITYVWVMWYAIVTIWRAWQPGQDAPKGASVKGAPEHEMQQL